MKKLVGFIKALERRDIINFKADLFNHRLKLQKYIYLARKYGLDLGYNYNLYIRGPYSPGLADDYYKLSREYIDAPLNDNFVSLIKGKSERWLELASTIVMVKEKYNIDNDTTIKLVKNSKSFATNEELRKIISELKLRNAI
ncbi:MAG: hypothetical protein HY930_04465 [Euryarchaeota archaeon]|nr:hypothetical protein [Euryarchaeota archaeon]